MNPEERREKCESRESEKEGYSEVSGRHAHISSEGISMRNGGRLMTVLG